MVNRAKSIAKVGRKHNAVDRYLGRLYFGFNCTRSTARVDCWSHRIARYGAVRCYFALPQSHHWLQSKSSLRRTNELGSRQFPFISILRFLSNNGVLNPLLLRAKQNNVFVLFHIRFFCFHIFLNRYIENNCRLFLSEVNFETDIS